MVFFNFFAFFFGIFYSALGRNGTKREFLFSPFLRLLQPILARNGAIMALFNILNFFPIFLKFSNVRQVGTERNETIIFPFLLSHPPSTSGCLKWSHNVIFNFFLNFFAVFLEFFIKRWVGMKQNENIYFHSFSAVSNLFWP